jgi:hypothetical protein
MKSTRVSDTGLPLVYNNTRWRSAKIAANSSLRHEEAQPPLQDPTSSTRDAESGSLPSSPLDQLIWPETICIYHLVGLPFTDNTLAVDMQATGTATKVGTDVFDLGLA